MFLPPYSPDLNPVEELFSAIKYYLKEHDDILQAMPNPTPLIKSAFALITSLWSNAMDGSLTVEFIKNTHKNKTKNKKTKTKQNTK